MWAMNTLASCPHTPSHVTTRGQKVTRESQTAERYFFFLAALAIALEYEYTPSSIGVEYLKGRDRLLYDILAEHFNISLEIVHQNWRAITKDKDEDYRFTLCGLNVVDPRYLELLDGSNDKRAWRWFLALEDDEFSSDYIEK
ncbi:unnamed protein product [Vitrella brassicaformis CCMP3155]|uniref:Uncharacterized protein n=1 Tax=Vitrella brassicaformis (strain CCMP3155) TaxID=1169540 RepID=A0A0G4ELZ8_VITBC|nr:unnamed protein product [Vitrella brassicaformis CCMP3155]|eukprot:CEL98152.1 unnamed protein product [Vitrella brassicaformis CCMP3155]